MRKVKALVVYYITGEAGKYGVEVRRWYGVVSHAE